jgi:short subunit dehydrogenase-like uncharacterized protein
LAKLTSKEHPMTNRNRHQWLIYGAYGFTGRLVAEEAVRRGHRPVLAGRSGQKLQAMADQMGLEFKSLSLDDPQALRDALRSTRLIFNAAGPFSETGPKIIEACLETGAAYADISGEFHHLRAVEGFDARARTARIPILTGAGFGATFGDCLARHVVDRLPDATHLRLSVAAGNAVTTSAVRRTILEVLAKGGYAVEGGRWKHRSLAHQHWTVPDGGSPAAFAAAPMGELAAVRLSTNVANIMVGRPMAAKSAKRLRLMSPLVQGVLGLGPLRRALGRDKGGPSAPASAPEGGWRSRIWAEARNARGDRVMARLETGEGYAATAAAAITNVEALLARPLVGVHTPALAFGAAHVRTIPGVQVTDLDPESGLPLQAGSAALSARGRPVPVPAS